MKIQIEEDDRHMSRVVHTSIGTVTYVSIKFALFFWFLVCYAVTQLAILSFFNFEDPT